MMKRIVLILFMIGISPALGQTFEDDIKFEDKSERSWPCEILLCMANPSGPTDLDECLPPLRRMMLHLIDPFAGFPGCPGSSGNIKIDRSLISHKVKSLQAYDETGLYPKLKITKEIEKKLNSPLVSDPYGPIEPYVPPRD